MGLECKTIQEFFRLVNLVIGKAKKKDAEPELSTLF
jgi:hypothetical protein